MGDVDPQAPSRETGYTTLGTLEFLLDERRRALLHGDEHAHPGRAPGHRDGHRRRPRRASRSAPRPASSSTLPDTRPWSFRGHAIECRINAEDPRHVRALAGPDHRVPPARRRRRARRLRRLRRLARAAALRLAARQGHRPRRRRAREAIATHAARARRVHHRRHPHEHPAAPALLRDPEVVAGNMSTRTIERVVAQGF